MILYFVIIIIIIIFYYNYKNEIKYNKLTSLNFIKYNLKPRNNIKYVCWTGGFDSTFIVCNYISKGYTVQPIYLDFKNLDDIYIPLIQTKRRNSKIEIIKMKEIRLMIKKFKNHSNLLPTKFITKQKPDRNILEIMSYIHTKYNLFTRKTNQYERIIEVAYHYKIPLEIGVQKSTSDDFYKLKKRGLITKMNSNYEIIQNLPSNYKLLGILKTLRFPILELSKHEMLSIAEQNQFDDILKQTWSCWFPVYKNKKHYPCGKCYMCKERII